MVHFSDAPLANPTVMSPRGAVHFASGADGPVLFGWLRVIFGMGIGKVDSVLGQRHDTRVGKDCSAVRHEQEEHNQVEQDHVEGTPERSGHGLENDPSDHDVVGVEHGAVGHKEAGDAARVSSEDHGFVGEESGCTSKGRGRLSSTHHFTSCQKVDGPKKG